MDKTFSLTILRFLQSFATVMTSDDESESPVSDDDTPTLGGDYLGNKLEATLLLEVEGLVLAM